MRAIISAIMSAIRSAFGFAMTVLSAPLRMFGGGSSSRGGAPLPEVAPPIEIPEAPGPDYTEMYRQVAITLQTWAAESLLADERLPVPTAWPRIIKEWAGGLDREECFAIIDAPDHAVIGHISQVFAMQRVRSVQTLPATQWQKQEPMTIDPCFVHPSFLSAAAAVPA